MSDRKEYHRAYYQNKVKPKRAQEKEASHKLPDVLQDLTFSRIQMQMLQADKIELQKHIQTLEEEISILTIKNTQLETECTKQAQIISSMATSPFLRKNHS